MPLKTSKSDQRRYCKICAYPQTACVCHAVQPIFPVNRLVILQHPSEVTHNKNSVRLLKLAIPNTEVVIGETATDFAQLQAQLIQLEHVMLVYPEQSDNDLCVSKKMANNISAVKTLVLLDGTWRKVHRMLCLTPWLLALPRLSLQIDAGSNYRIRKAKRSDSLSTLEAAAFALQQLQPELNIEPALSLLDEMVSQRLARMPNAVRQRY